MGCGHGDFYFWMINQSAQPQSYVGVDLVPSHCRIARDRLPRECLVIEGDFLQASLEKCDIAVLSGALNIYCDGWSENAHKILDRIWQLCREGIVFTIRSPHGLTGPPSRLRAQQEDYIVFN